MPLTFRCDGEPDCVDASDEDSCGKNTPTLTRCSGREPVFVGGVPKPECLVEQQCPPNLFLPATAPPPPPRPATCSLSNTESLIPQMLPLPGQSPLEFQPPLLRSPHAGCQPPAGLRPSLPSPPWARMCALAGRTRLSAPTGSASPGTTCAMGKGIVRTAVTS